MAQWFSSSILPSLVLLGLTPTGAFPQIFTSSDAWLAVLYENSRWVRVDSLETGQEIFTKKIGGSGLPAILVRQKASVTPGSMVSAIEDVGDYPGFIHDAYLERAELLRKTSDFIDGYQLLDLPFMANRHYIFRMTRDMNVSSGRIRLDWTLAPENSQYSGFLDSMDTIYGHPTYPAVNVGGWEIVPLETGRMEVSYRLLVDPAGWVPDFLVARGNQITAPRMVHDMIREAMRRDER
ncbi:MAG: hypothetical protein ACE5GH_02195 [Fidelibacterota bacterium]